jgi:hypothetical protein
MIGDAGSSVKYRAVTFLPRKHYKIHFIMIRVFTVNIFICSFNCLATLNLLTLTDTMTTAYAFVEKAF